MKETMKQEIENMMKFLNIKQIELNAKDFPEKSWGDWKLTYQLPDHGEFLDSDLPVSDCLPFYDLVATALSNLVLQELIKREEEEITRKRMRNLHIIMIGGQPVMD